MPKGVIDIDKKINEFEQSLKALKKKKADAEKSYAEKPPLTPPKEGKGVSLPWAEESIIKTIKIVKIRQLCCRYYFVEVFISIIFTIFIIMLTFRSIYMLNTNRGHLVFIYSSNSIII